MAMKQFPFIEGSPIKHLHVSFAMFDHMPEGSNHYILNLPVCPEYIRTIHKKWLNEPVINLK